MRTPPRREAGFGMLEVVIGLGLLGILAMALGSIVNGMAKAQRNVSSQADHNNLVSTTQLVLNDRTQCTNAFRGLAIDLNQQNPQGSVQLGIPDGHGGTTLLIGDGQEQNGLRVGLRLKVLGFTAPATKVKNHITAALQLKSTKSDSLTSNSIGSSTRAIELPVTFQTTRDSATGNALVDCCPNDPTCTVPALNPAGGTCSETSDCAAGLSCVNGLCVAGPGPGPSPSASPSATPAVVIPNCDCPATADLPTAPCGWGASYGSPGPGCSNQCQLTVAGTACCPGQPYSCNCNGQPGCNGSSGTTLCNAAGTGYGPCVP